jgi:lipopolysaccharide export system permease protein
MLRILDRHVLREFVLYLLLGLCTFVGIYLIVDLFEKLDVFVDHQAAVGLILSYYLYKLPVIVVQVLPLAMLLAAILSLGAMRRLNEVTAMQSCGLSPLRITLPILVLAAIVTVGAFALGEELVPGAYRREQQTLDVRIKKKRPADALGRSDIRYMGRAGRVYLARQYAPRPPALIDLSLQQFRTGENRQQLWRRIDAASAHWGSNGFWQMETGYLRLLDDDREWVAGFRRYGDSRCVEEPDEFAQPESDPFFMNRHQLRDYIRRISEGGAQVQQYRVDYHLRAAFPVANLIMVLLGSCLSLRILRGTMALSFGLSISLGFAYYGFVRAGQALGYTGHLPPLLAAWMGNMVFGIVGGLLFWRANR